ncbi:hypothetical protein ACXHXM_04035|nr:hypothetical protein [Rhizobium altiplani]
MRSSGARRRPESPAGSPEICAANPQDDERIAQGRPVFGNLYQYFRATRG